MYKLKLKPEDFIVKEMLELPLSSGEYKYFLLKKRNYTTQKAVEKIARMFRVADKLVGFAGNKDRNAVTEQYISIKTQRKQGCEIDDISLEYMGEGAEPISLGDNTGNRFEITVRNIDQSPGNIGRFVNLFGDQRFSEKNVEIGKAIIKGDLAKACSLIDQKPVQEHLEKKPKDYVGALKTLPLRTLRIYVHSVSSYIWNQAARRTEQDKLPLVGFGTEPDPISKEIMREEGISQRDFIIRAIPDLSNEGDYRDVYCSIGNLVIGRLEGDELGKKKKCKVSFDLGKGCYATVAVDAMFSDV